MLILGNLWWRTTGQGAPPPQPPAPQPVDDRPKGTAEWLWGPPQKRTRDDISRERLRYGLSDAVAEAIAEVARRQAEAEAAASAAEKAAADEQKRFDELYRELELRQMGFEARYMEALAEMREEFIAQIRKQREEEELMLLMLVAAAAAM